MSNDGSDGRFTPRPRKAAEGTYDLANLTGELNAILARTQAVAATSRDSFHDGTDSYDVASMVIIRLAALLERPEFDEYLSVVTRDERLAISTTRHIAAHAGCKAMNDELFWAAVTRRVPRIIERVLGGLP